MNWTLILAALGVLGTFATPLISTVLEMRRRDKRLAVLLQCAQTLESPDSSPTAKAIAAEQLATYGMTVQDLFDLPAAQARHQAEQLFAKPRTEGPVEDPEITAIRKVCWQLARLSRLFDAVVIEDRERRLRMQVLTSMMGLISATLIIAAIYRHLG